MANRTSLEVIEKLRGTGASQPAPTTSQLSQFEERVGGRLEELRNKIFKVDPEFDQSGVRDFTFRMDLSRMDTPQERRAFLTEKVGPQGFTEDRFGNPALTPAGMEAMGLEHSGRPVLIDEPEITGADIADLRGAAPSIAGATLAGVASGGLGALPAIGLTAAGTAVGRGIDEAIDAFRGQNLQSPGEIAAMLSQEAVLGAGGEAFSRGVLLPIGRKLMAPQAARVTPQAKELMDDALALGLKPNVSQITRAPILGRTQAMMNRVLGDPLAFSNSKRMGEVMDELIEGAGKKISSRTNLGEMIQNDIRRARREFGTDSSAMYQVFDDSVGGRPIIPTARLKMQAEAIMNEMPRGKTGRPLFTSPETAQHLNDVAGLPDFITGKQMQAVRSRLWDASRVNNLVPGLESRHARLMRRAADQAFDDTSMLTPTFIARHMNIDLTEEGAAEAFVEAGPQKLVSNAIKALRQADEFYVKGVRQFDNNIVSRITRDPSLAGSIDPESIIDVVFKKGRSTNVNRVMNAVSPDVQSNIRAAAMSDILDNLRDNVTDPLEEIFNGKKFMETLNAYGEETLNAMFGKARAKELYKFGRVAQLVTQRQAMSGGLVAAHIALHPLQNVTRLVRMRAMSAIMNSDNGLKWLTTGLEAPKTRAGAAALSRLSAQAAFLVDEDNNSLELP